MKRTIFVLLVGGFIFLCCSALYWPFLPFFPIQKIKSLPKGDLLVFTAHPFSNREFLSGTSLFVLNTKTHSIRNWHGLVNVRVDQYWTSKQDKVLVSTGRTYAGEPINHYLLTTVGDKQHIDLRGELSPDGKTIAYSEKFSLFVYDLATQRSHNLTPPNIWIDEFAWSPDSRSISFISPDEVSEVFEGAYKTSDTFKIMRVDRDDRAILSLTKTLKDEYVRNLQFSGDGTMLSLYYASRIHIFFADGQGYYEMPKFVNECLFSAPAYSWLHQGAKLSMFCGENLNQLWVLNTKTNSAELIKEFTELNLNKVLGPHEMSWSGDDTQLAFTIVRKNEHCAATWEGTSMCPEDIYMYDRKGDVLEKVAIKNWLYDIRDIEWLKVNTQ